MLSESIQPVHEVEGFLRAEGTKLINESGQEIILRGVGFGSWLLPEGYMWLFPEKGDRPRRIEQMIKELIGHKKAEQFWETYYERYISIGDIRQIAKDGYNSVRIPINSRFLIEEDTDEALRYKEKHLRLIDQVIAWCREYRLYVILDLHGAPGGQTGTNIDDSEKDLPELFLYERNKQITIDLWRKLAERYKEEWIVAGYDLLNEPLPNWFSTYNDQVMPLYRDITKAIREVDDRHMIILEGAHWATDWSIFDHKFDDNLMLQFHKYWNNPDTESIQKYLDKRADWNVPIYMGEGGENNKEWYAGAFRLFEDHDISWNFWTWKKLERDNSPCTVTVPAGWSLLIDYLEGGPKPAPETAERILWEYLHNIAFEHCIVQSDVTRALFRRPGARIPAIFYGYYGEGLSYGVQNRVDHGVGFRVQDGTDIRFVNRKRAAVNFEHGKGETWQEDELLYVHLAAGDWLAYEFRVEKDSEASLLSAVICMLAPDGESELSVTLDNRGIEQIRVRENSWLPISLQESFRLQPGLHRIVLKAVKNPLDIQWLEITPSH